MISFSAYGVYATKVPRQLPYISGSRYQRCFGPWVPKVLDQKSKQCAKYSVLGMQLAISREYLSRTQSCVFLICNVADAHPILHKVIQSHVSWVWRSLHEMVCALPVYKWLQFGRCKPKPSSRDSRDWMRNNCGKLCTSIVTQQLT